MPVLKLLIQEREIRGEAFAEPHIVPILLRRRVAEPLMGDLMGHYLTARAGLAISIEDRGRQFHAATDSVGFHLSRLLVGIGTDPVDEELDNRLCERAEAFETDIPVLWKDPGRERNAAVFPEVVHGKWRNPQRHQARA